MEQITLFQPPRWNLKANHLVVGRIADVELHGAAHFLQGQAARIVEARQRRIQQILTLEGELEGQLVGVMLC